MSVYALPLLAVYRVYHEVGQGKARHGEHFLQIIKSALRRANECTE